MNRHELMNKGDVDKYPYSTLLTIQQIFLNDLHHSEISYFLVLTLNTQYILHFQLIISQCDVSQINLSDTGNKDFDSGN